MDGSIRNIMGFGNWEIKAVLILHCVHHLHISLPALLISHITVTNILTVARGEKVMT